MTQDELTATLVVLISIDDHSEVINQGVKLTVTRDGERYCVHYSDLSDRPIDGLETYCADFRDAEDALAAGINDCLANVSAMYREQIEPETS